MRKLSLEQMADYLEEAQIETSIRVGVSNVYIGINLTGCKFVMVSDGYDDVVITESF